MQQSSIAQHMTDGEYNKSLTTTHNKIQNQK